jgi:peptidyl-prolyl cis-trans isomerase C
MRRLLVLGLCALATACQPQSASPKKTGTPVARGAGFTITTDEFKARIDEQSPFIRARYSTLDRKKEFLDNLVRQELLAVEAERQGLDKDPEVRATLRKIMVQKLVQKRFQQEPGAAPDVPEADLQKYYDEHKAEYVRPRKVRVHAVVFTAPTGSPERAKKLAVAKKALQKVKTEEKKNPLAFAQAVAEYSDDAASKAAAGDLQFRSYEELEASYSKDLAKTAFALKPGELSGVVEGPQAIYLLKAIGEQPEVNRTFDQVKTQIASKLSREKKTKEFDEWMKGLKDKAQITIDEKALESVEVAAAPMPPGGGGHMGMGGMPPMGGGMHAAPQPAAPQPAAPPAPAAPAR